jgi:hypothetical protein
VGEALVTALGVDERRARLAAPVVPRARRSCTSAPRRRRVRRLRRDSAWLWYGIAAAALLAFLLLDLTGVLGSLGP